jgi:hypothetical protein
MLVLVVVPWVSFYTVRHSHIACAQWALPTCKLCSIQKAPWGLLRFCGCSRRAARSWSAGNSNSEFAGQIGRTGPTEAYYM